jgi:putative membrane protein
VAASAADSAFLKDACQGGIMEMKLGQLAQTNASSQQVKDFGQRMVNDHSRMNMSVRDLAGKQSVTLPSDISIKDKITYDLISKKTGADFDRAYMEDMIADHKADVAAFEREVESGTDPEAKAVAQKALPTIREHLRMAEEIGRQLGVKP